MKEQFYKQLINYPGIKQIERDLLYYTDKNMKILYQGSNILSQNFIINPYITIDCNSDKNKYILYPIINLYENLIIESELITRYDSILISIKDYNNKINGYDILDAIGEENRNLLIEDNLNFLLRKYFSCLFLINDYEPQ